MQPTSRPFLATASIALAAALATALASAPTGTRAAAPATEAQPSQAAGPVAATAATETAFATALATFNRALAGEDAALDIATTQFQALLAADPTQPAFRAFLGSATAMKARTTLLPWKKMGYADDGLAQIDKALAQLTPGHDRQTLGGVATSALVRFTAGSTFVALPSMFNRSDRGARLLDDLRKSAVLAAAPAAFRAQVLAQPLPKAP